MSGTVLSSLHVDTPSSLRERRYNYLHCTHEETEAERFRCLSGCTAASGRARIAKQDTQISKLTTAPTHPVEDPQEHLLLDKPGVLLTAEREHSQHGAVWVSQEGFRKDLRRIWFHLR